MAVSLPLETSLLSPSLLGSAPEELADRHLGNTLKLPKQTRTPCHTFRYPPARSTALNPQFGVKLKRMLPDDDTYLLRNSSIFGGLGDAELEAITRASQTRRLGNGAFYFMEGDPAKWAYVLLAGKVKLGQVTANGQQVILGYLVPGRVYGIIAILKKVTYPVSAQAVGQCKALGWDQDSLNQLIERYPRIALNAMRIMAGQIREFQNSVRDLSTKRVNQRIAGAVLRLTRQTGRKVDAGVLIDLPLSRQDLAEMTGTTLYTVSRVLSEWESQGLVSSTRKQVTILYPHGLVQIAEDLPDQKAGDKKMVGEGLCDL